MSKPTIKIAKGVKDSFGKEAILRNKVKNKLRSIFEKYGYNPIETPIMELVETLGYKGGGEIQKEVFRLTDQGNRNLGLRFDHTVPLARFYATNDVKLPFKRYAMGEVFRDGPTQVEQGRYRSFTQCDIDVLGVKDMSAEVEIFSLSKEAFQTLGLGGVDVRINNRKILNGVLDYAGVPMEAKIRTITALDKLDKIGLTNVVQELGNLELYKTPQKLTNSTLKEIGDVYQDKTDLPNGLARTIIGEVGEVGLQNVYAAITDSKDMIELTGKLDVYENTGGKAIPEIAVEKLVNAIRPAETNVETYNKLKKLIGENEGLSEIKEILDYSNELGLDFINFEPSLARGLDYYTGTTLEVYLKDKSIINSAIMAGGRFDDMVGDFKGDGKEVPAFGASFGLERLTKILVEQKDNLVSNTTQIYLIPIGETKKETFTYAQQLRGYGLNVDMTLNPDIKVKKAIQFAQNVGIPYVGFVGDDEVRTKTIAVKNLETGKQENLDVGSTYMNIACDTGRFLR